MDMSKLENAADRIGSLLKEKDAERFHYSVTEEETREFNYENGSFTLYRTLFDDAFHVTVYQQNRPGTVAGNDLTEESLRSSVEDALHSAAAAEPDEAWGIAPDAGEKVFSHGPLEPDPERLFSRLQELRQIISAEYPLVQIMMMIAKHVKARTLYRNSSGSCFEELAGYYSVMLEFAGNDGEQTTGLDYTGVLLTDLEKPLIDCGSFREHLENAQAQLRKVELPEKFTGTVILTPDCLGEFLYSIVGNYLSDSVLLDGTSKWKDKLGEKVADECFSLSLRPLDPQIACGERYTGSGFVAENMTLIENGVLQNFSLSLYAANKTGFAPAKTTDTAFFVQPGEKPLAEIIKGTKRGLLVGGFSGGQPGANGEFSGVAKNSYYIEDGEIRGAVSETMINGSLDGILRDIVAISRETVADGGSVLPWLAADGIVVSGK